MMLEVRSRCEWQKWLEKNHASSAGVWLVFYRKETGRECVTYEDSVRDALCFGWVDSLIKRIDDERHARKFTPRRPESKWSESEHKLTPIPPHP